MGNGEGRKDRRSKRSHGSFDKIELHEDNSDCSDTEDMTSSGSEDEAKEKLQEPPAPSASKENVINGSNRKRKCPADKEPSRKKSKKIIPTENPVNQFFINYSNSPMFQASVKAYLQKQQCSPKKDRTTDETSNSSLPRPG